jgi:hypothetical protein
MNKIIEGQMQVAKFIISIFFIFGKCLIASSQNISGTYQKTEASLFANDIGIKYIFKDNGEFVRTKYENLENQTIIEGSFSISDDTLTLYYQDLDKNLDAVIEITQKEKLNSNTILESTIKILNSSGNPIEAANLVLQSQDKTPVMAFMSNKLGEFPKINLYDSYIKFLQISYLGNKEIYVSTDSLFGYRSKINVCFKNSEFVHSNKRQTEKFLIKKNTSEKLELKNIDSNSSSLELKKIE